MKKLLPIFCFILFSNYSFSQIRKAGNFYELNDLWQRDSIPVKQLINKFNLDLTKLDTIQYFKQFKLHKQLYDEYSHTTYIYTLYKKTDTVTMESYYTERTKPMLNKYVLLLCMNDYTDKKIINIQVF